MKVGGRPYRTIWPAEDGKSVMAIDQTKLPHAFEVVPLRSSDSVADAIRRMVVRGAPLIGVAGAYGLAIGLRDDATDAGMDRAHAMLLATRPDRRQSRLGARSCAHRNEALGDHGAGRSCIRAGIRHR